jgi:hypothetical protein
MADRWAAGILRRSASVDGSSYQAPRHVRTASGPALPRAHEGGLAAAVRPREGWRWRDGSAAEARGPRPAGDPQPGTRTEPRAPGAPATLATRTAPRHGRRAPFRIQRRRGGAAGSRPSLGLERQLRPRRNAFATVGDRALLWRSPQPPRLGALPPADELRHGAAFALPAGPCRVAPLQPELARHQGLRRGHGPNPALAAIPWSCSAT